MKRNTLIIRSISANGASSSSAFISGSRNSLRVFESGTVSR